MLAQRVIGWLIVVAIVAASWWLAVSRLGLVLGIASMATLAVVLGAVAYRGRLLEEGDS